jgi:hypothetical protein
MLDALADFVANRMQIAEFELNTGTGTTRRYKYRTLAELKEGIAFAKSMVDDEGNSAPGRTYAKNGGGRW